MKYNLIFHFELNYNLLLNLLLPSFHSEDLNVQLSFQIKTMVNQKNKFFFSGNKRHPVFNKLVNNTNPNNDAQNNKFLLKNIFIELFFL